MAHHEDDDFEQKPFIAPIRSTHTIATLDVPTFVYDYIEKKLRSFSYDHVFLDDGTIDMTGIGLTKGKESSILIERTENGGKYAGYPRSDGSGTIGSDDPHDALDAMAQVTDSIEDMGEYAKKLAEQTLDSFNSLTTKLHCRQCDQFCAACAIGEPHMNIALPFPEYTHERTGEVDWQAHNAKGSHHVMWDNAKGHNVTVECGSEYGNRLARKSKERRDKKEADRVANERQVGGSHYGEKPFQHWDVVVMFKMDYFQGNITKYVFRWRDKNGIEDLEKARHYLEKYIEEIKAGRI